MSDFNIHEPPRQPFAVYTGCRDEHGHALVFRNAKPFDPRVALARVNHVPGGFEWSYVGRGPSRLALAILVDQYDVITATELHEAFALQVFKPIEAYSVWRLTAFDVHAHVLRIVDQMIHAAHADVRLPLTAEVM